MSQDGTTVTPSSSMAGEARGQTLTRDINEWIADASESLGLGPALHTFRCECGDSRCGRTIDVTRPEYEAVRAYATRFAIATDHENPESDRVVAEHGRYSVVEKLGGHASGEAHRSYRR
ncbi:MAG: hypothetical protein H0T13_05400 [Actinobacteria bacterium]|nr:hypothetical protein [Actinomycetota bacterium]